MLKGVFKMRFVILYEPRDQPLSKRCFGIYRSFMTADKDARAVSGPQGEACVVPVEPIADLP
jgi:hypothetical protein